ncbi:Cof-type HAD-IIB family hydrolase [uncultured Helcococcus sp.]|uniref:Cof-type HAD-IIB family hydrolase n=1 Tax=uncultured Helcococcus sp. TaxID=1072508 RepID=UPI002888FD7B|nr:Cof-type HAD-IIB family hydrolase [uncultured Helcococcus sp.]
MNKPDIKYIALDMDGTLLSSDHVILPKTKEALMEAQEKGIQLIIATGRPLKSIHQYAEELKLAEYGGLIIGSNGGIIYDPKKDEVLYQAKLSKEQAKRIFEVLENYDLIPYFIDKDDILYAQQDEAHITLSNGDSMEVFDFELAMADDYRLKNVGSLKDYVDWPIDKVLNTANPKYIADNYKKLQADLGEDFTVVPSLDFILEIFRSDVSKGNALEFIEKDFNHTMAFGDGMNDYHMLEVSKYSIAMGNAAEEIKELATDITDTNDNEGIYKSLKKYQVI